MAGVAKDVGRVFAEVRERLAARLERSAHVGRLAGELCGLRLAELFTCAQQVIELLAIAPVELIRDPRGDRWFGERLDLIRACRVAVFLQFRGERVAC